MTMMGGLRQECHNTMTDMMIAKVKGPPHRHATRVATNPYVVMSSLQTVE
jgi:hypothetical protein